MNKILSFTTLGSPSTGYLSFFEDSTIGFLVKRVYYIYGSPIGTQRGFHAHKKLQQIIWCPYGDISFILDDGTEREEIRLNKPSVGFKIEQGIWREMRWNKADSVLCVAASMGYDEADYIRDYDEFIRLVKEGYWK